MPPIVLTLVQALLLLLLYLFVARAVRAVVRDLSLRAPAPAAVSGAPAARPTRGGRGERRPLPTQLVVHHPEGRPQVVPLDAHDVTFGRADVSTVVLNDPYASDHHARVYLSDGSWLVTDLGSTNGTYLNSSKVSSPTPVSAGDQLAIGKTVVQVRR